MTPLALMALAERWRSEADRWLRRSGSDPATLRRCADQLMALHDDALDAEHAHVDELTCATCGHAEGWHAEEEAGGGEFTGPCRRTGCECPKLVAAEVVA